MARSRGVPIYRIGKISAADMAKFSMSAIGNCTDIFTDFYTSTNWLILLMHCLVITIFTVDNHFTSFVAIFLLFTMNFIILYVQYRIRGTFGGDFNLAVWRR